ncbi:sporulation integral membrane protein YtvI [Lachnospiraceae bacterium XBB1006]|nr:sporulation integral membrane protein YtvI [Lachnospiraceae bacterium XBB1006]
MKRIIQLLLNLLLPLMGLLLVLWLVPRLLSLFMPFVIGYLISLMANPLVRFLEHRLKIVRKTGSAIVIVLAIGLIALLVYGVVAAVASQTEHLLKDVPAMAQNAKVDYATMQDTLDNLIVRLPSGMQEKLADVNENVGEYVMNWFSALNFNDVTGGASKVVSNIPSILIGLIVGLLASYFFIAQKHEFEAFLSRHTSQSVKEKFHLVKVQLFDVLGGYFKAQFKIMAVVYVILVIGLGILHTGYFFLTAFGIAFVDMLPFFGTGTILGPWAIIKILTGDYKMAIALVVLYGVTQLVRQLIQPKLLGDSIGMNPFATLFFMYLGYLMGSVLGMILAVPIAMIVMNLYEAGVFDTMIYAGKTLWEMLQKFIHLDVPQDVAHNKK